MEASAELESRVNFASVLRCVRSFDFSTVLRFNIKCHLSFSFRQRVRLQKTSSISMAILLRFRHELLSFSQLQNCSSEDVFSYV